MVTEWIISLRLLQILLTSDILTFSKPAKPLPLWDMLKCGGFFFVALLVEVE